MEFENEITVLVTVDYESLHKELVKYQFKIKETFQQNDIYMINKNIDVDCLNFSEILKECILVRNIINIKKMLLYKYKKYKSNGDIEKQGKIVCPITNIQQAIAFMKAINYRKLFEIKDNCVVYVNDKTELIVQLVNDKYIFIEMEDESQYLNKHYSNVEKMITEFESYNLPYAKNNYFVSKAEIILNEIIKK